MPLMAESIKSSPKELLALLHKTGRLLRDSERAGVDKLDLLVFVAERVMERVTSKQKPGVTVAELNGFLAKEGRKLGDDVKQSLEELWRLRRERLDQRGHYVRARADGGGSPAPGPAALEEDPLLLALQLLPSETVRDLFEEEEFDAEVASATPQAASEAIVGGEAEPQADGAKLELTALQSSAQVLKELLRKTEHPMTQLDGLEKVDLVSLIKEGVKSHVLNGSKMSLKLSNLQAFLETEGYRGAADAKQLVTALVQLRQDQLRRLGHYASKERTVEAQSDEVFVSDLELLSGAEVEDVFAISLPEAGKSVDSAAANEPRTKRPRVADASPAAGSMVSSSSDVRASAQEPEQELAPELAGLLEEHTTAHFGSCPALTTLLPEEPEAVAQGSADGPSLKDECTEEVERVLKAKFDSVIEGATAAERWRRYRRAILLLHPDRGLVSPDDRRANIALRKMLLAWKRQGGKKP